jgi:hypothetical protein
VSLAVAAAAADAAVESEAEFGEDNFIPALSKAELRRKARAASKRQKGSTSDSDDDDLDISMNTSSRISGSSKKSAKKRSPKWTAEVSSYNNCQHDVHTRVLIE